MSKKLYLPIILTALFASVISCNSSSDTEYDYVQSSAVTVTSFKLKNDKKVLDSLANVFFSIDLVNAKIFNADSLPYGTKVSRLIPDITVASGVSAVQLSYYCPEIGRDSVVDYKSNSTDSIDFSQGPVKLTVTSQNALVKLEYEIKVNVHKIKSDSLAWYRMESAPLPTALQKVTAQRTVKLGEKFYCLTTDANVYSLATTDNPYQPQWTSTEVNLGFDADIESLNASESALYMLSRDGMMYTSTDCITWTETGKRWHNIYGGYADQILGCTLATDSEPSKIHSYPSEQSWTMPTAFPVSGTSMPASYSLQMGYAPQLVLVGGRLADGTLTDGAWGFDGENWMEVSTKQITRKLEYMTLVPYNMVQTPSSSWAPQSYPVLLAFGGVTENGAINRDVYYSRDWGMTWSYAPELMQLPDEMPAIYGGTAYEYSNTMYPNSRSTAWTEMPVRTIPPHCTYIDPAQSRAIAPLTQWECPAIYLFSGKNYAGETVPEIWRGVIYQFTFEPVQ